VKHQKVKFWPLKTKFKASPKKKGGGGKAKCGEKKERVRKESV